MNIHRWWTGEPTESNVPASVWEKFDHNVIDWTPESFPLDEYPGTVPPEDEPRHRSNIARYAILLVHGGVWVDHDVTPLRSLAGLEDKAFTASVGSWREGAVMGGPAGHPFFKDLMCGINGTGRSPYVSGARYLSRVAERHEVMRMPPGAFFDIDSHGRPIRYDGIRYTKHVWATSSKRLARL